jgi:tetratricopeptide (TPR) repeat protein
VASLNSFKLTKGLATHKINDYFAVLGLPLTTNVGDIRKKFMVLAKSLHPDVFSLSELQRAWAEKYYAKMVSPSYKILNTDYSRDEYFATLRYLASDLKKLEEAPIVQSALAQKLLRLPHEVNYNQYVSEIAAKQYTSLSRALEYTDELSELNLVFLYTQSQIGQPARVVVVPDLPSSSELPKKPIVSKALPKIAAAEAFIAKKKWADAIAELKLAEKLDPEYSQIYALMGVVYLAQKSTAVAKSCFQKALKLNPKDEIALNYTTKDQPKNQPATKAATDKTKTEPKVAAKKAENKGGLFGFFGKK